jgi:hypothetical protein
MPLPLSAAQIEFPFVAVGVLLGVALCILCFPRFAAFLSALIRARGLVRLFAVFLALIMAMAISLSRHLVRGPSPVVPRYDLPRASELPALPPAAKKAPRRKPTPSGRTPYIEGTPPPGQG